MNPPYIPDAFESWPQRRMLVAKDKSYFTLEDDKGYSYWHKVTGGEVTDVRHIKLGDHSYDYVFFDDLPGAVEKLNKLIGAENIPPPPDVPILEDYAGPHKWAEPLVSTAPREN